MARVNVMISEQMLEAIDHVAEEENISRSGLLEKAAHHYLDAEKKKKEANEQKHRMEKAAENMDRLADKFGKWDGVGIIRRFRDQRMGTK